MWFVLYINITEKLAPLLCLVTGYFFSTDLATKPCVHGKRREESVMASHDAETLEERSAVVLVGHAAIEVVGNHFRQAQELQMLALSTLHDAYAPVDVGRKAVAQVVRLGTCYVCAGVERLVAHQHAVTKRAPVEFVGGASRRGCSTIPFSSTMSVSP